jgi:hypothetical protein
MMIHVTREQKPSRREYRDSRYGAGYDAFRTGLTFRQARRMLWAPEHDPKRWRPKSRRDVLGFMHELKLQFWAQYQDAVSTANEGNRS